MVEQGTLAQWREAILMAVGYLVYISRDTDKPLALVGELCPAQPREDDVSWRKAWLAGDALVEIGANRVTDSALGRDLLERVQQRLADLLRSSKLAPRERASGGNTLARLGDSRVEVTTVDAMPFCYVPPGEFVMGGEGEKEHTNKTLSYGYWISRYPITNAQFTAFVEAGGYAHAAYWREATVHGWWKAGQFKGRFDDVPRNRPYDFGEPFNLSNHPVVGVAWYEALAFTRWLTERWRAQNILSDRWEARLPSEAEWEKAARGGVEIPVEPVVGPLQLIGPVALRRNELPRRAFPWGTDADPNRANYDDTKINATNTAGCFTLGQSPYGCEEMSGNVWEWTRSLWGKDWQKPNYKYPYNASDGRENLEAGGDIYRVLRGGAFSNLEWDARCAYRYGANPDDGCRNGGCRLVVVPL